MEMRGISPFHGYGCNGRGILHIRYNWPMSCWLRPAPTFHCCHTDGMQVLDTKQKGLFLLILPTQSITQPQLVSWLNLHNCKNEQKRCQAKLWLYVVQTYIVQSVRGSMRGPVHFHQLKMSFRVSTADFIQGTSYLYGWSHRYTLDRRWIQAFPEALRANKQCRPILGSRNHLRRQKQCWLLKLEPHSTVLSWFQHYLAVGIYKSSNSVCFQGFICPLKSRPDA